MENKTTVLFIYFLYYTFDAYQISYKNVSSKANISWAEYVLNQTII